jgi:hypothetical protein
MTRLSSSLALFLIAVCIALLGHERDAIAQSSAELCQAASCAGGARKCAELSGTFLPPECEEGVMCCPFEEESFSITCYER